MGTCVSTCSLNNQSKQGKLSSNEAVKLSRPHIEDMNSHDKTILTRTFQPSLQMIFSEDIG